MVVGVKARPVVRRDAVLGTLKLGDEVWGVGIGLILYIGNWGYNTPFIYWELGQPEIEAGWERIGEWSSMELSWENFEDERGSSMVWFDGLINNQ